ncbi:hypothetical protein [Lysobacter sp. CA199]|uniref:hypothetical protein n=1 Tax=Lysobacter sp. CA199 TaxID=3455608 RepID=UPI003F8D3A35
MPSSPFYDEQRLREFFAGYERGANTFETELVTSAFAEQHARGRTDRCAGAALSAAAMARAISW